ncbi:MAG TPA: DUF4956 domain-containing protein [Pirellulaceae bacterium]|nr:DUF4956 domain-containing protein [Pirellulaceae bacterium]
MPDWLMSLDANADGLSAAEFGLRMLAALAMGGLIAAIYRVSHGRENQGEWTLCTTLILLCALIAMVTVVIGGSVAKAFSLVGAFSIVRFRTIVEDSRDTAFVIFSVIIGMAAGSGHLLLPAIGIFAVGGAACLLSLPLAWQKSKSVAMRLNLRVSSGRNPTEFLTTISGKYLDSFRLQSVGTAKQGAAVDYAYAVQLRSADLLPEIANALAQMEGVMGVEMKPV